MSADLLQLCPPMPGLEAARSERFTAHRRVEASNPAVFLASRGHRIRGVVTGGPLGIPADAASRRPALEIKAINGVGADKVDLAKAERRGVRVFGMPDVPPEDVADLDAHLAGRDLPTALV